MQISGEALPYVEDKGSGCTWSKFGTFIIIWTIILLTTALFGPWSMITHLVEKFDETSIQSSGLTTFLPSHSSLAKSLAFMQVDELVMDQFNTPSWLTKYRENWT